MIKPLGPSENENFAPKVKTDLSEESKHDHIQIDFASAGSSSTLKRKRGRPKGSKNKPKPCKLHSLFNIS